MAVKSLVNTGGSRPEESDQRRVGQQTERRGGLSAGIFVEEGNAKDSQRTETVM